MPVSVLSWHFAVTTPKGETKFSAVEGGFSYASDLVALIREYFPHFGIGVGGYPEKHQSNRHEPRFAKP